MLRLRAQKPLKRLKKRPRLLIGQMPRTLMLQPQRTHSEQPEIGLHKLATLLLVQAIRPRWRGTKPRKLPNNGMAGS